MKGISQFVLGVLVGASVVFHYILQAQITNEVEIGRLRGSVDAALSLGCKEVLTKNGVIKNDKEK